jgi:hypothetical protein
MAGTTARMASFFPTVLFGSRRKSLPLLVFLKFKKASLR